MDQRIIDRLDVLNRFHCVGIDVMTSCHILVPGFVISLSYIGQMTFGSNRHREKRVALIPKALMKIQTASVGITNTTAAVYLQRERGP